MFDYHMHSRFSEDGQMTMDEACLKSIELGLDEIAFADHMDIDWPDSAFTFCISNLDEYIKSIETVQKKYKGRLVVKKGIEIGLQHHALDECHRIASSYDFDFIIASVHLVNGRDPYFKAFYDGKTKEQAYGEYYRQVLDLVREYDSFNVLGHLEYIKRYCPFTCTNDEHMNHLHTIDDILKTLISKGKGLEINTAELGSRINTTLPHVDILKRYNELGGSIITMGSDAHKTESIANKFSEGLSILRKAGFSHLTTFSSGNATNIKI